MKVEVLHTGTVIVDEALPYHHTNDAPWAWTGFFRSKSHQVEVPVSCYLLEGEHGLALIDTGWHTDNRTVTGQIKNLRFQYAANKAKLPEGEAIHEQLEERGIKPRDLDLVMLSHLHCDHADGLRLIKEAPRIMVSEVELRAAEKDRLRYLPHEWAGINLQTFQWNTTVGNNKRPAWDVYGDRSVLMVSVPGHAYGLNATLIYGSNEVKDVPANDAVGNDPRSYVLLTSDVGYGRPSFSQRLRPSVVVDAAAAERSLDWAIAAGNDPRCIERIANHDPEITPHEILLP